MFRLVLWATGYGGLADNCQQVCAGLFTASAGLSTYTAMVVHVGVFFALGGTFRTRDATRFQHCLHGGQITAGAPTEQVTSRGAHIGAV